jgi:hypothetical protein
MDTELKTKKKWSLRRKILTAFLAMAGVATMVIMPGLFWDLHEANKALHGFCDALVAKQYKAAYGFTSKEFQASVDFKTFAQVHGDLTLRMGDLKSAEVTHSEIKDQSGGSYGTAETTMNFAHGSLTFIYVLKKNGGSWEIYNYHEQ